MRLSLYGNTNVGRHRDHNEDSYLIVCEADDNWIEVNDLVIDLSKSKGVVFVVADGMGGTNAGEVASDIAIKVVKEHISKILTVTDEKSEIEKILNSIVLEGHNRIIKASRKNKALHGMGTTIVLGCVINDSLYVVWSGDSRCYVYNKNFDKALQPFTDDHSLVWERVRNKEINEEEARLSDDSNLILQSLGGIYQKPEPDFRWIKLKRNDRILFCSDGLNSMLSNIGIQQILDYNSSPKETCESLIQAANNAGGRDNITSIVIDILDDGEEISKSDNIDTHIETKGKKSKVKKKNPFGLLVLVFFIIIVISGILFRTEIKRTVHSLFTGDDSIQNKDSSNSTETSELTIQKSIVKSMDDSAKMVGNIERKANNTPLNSDKNENIDTSYIENQLKKALDKITFIKNNVEWYKPGGKIGSTTDFYNRIKETLDSIMTIVGRQEELIKTIGNLTTDNKLVNITDYQKANSIYKEVGDTLAELEKRTKDVFK